MEAFVTVALDGATEMDFTLLGGPPLAKLGESESVAAGVDVGVSEHAANAKAMPAAAMDAPTKTAVLVRISTLAQGSLGSVDTGSPS